MDPVFASHVRAIAITQTLSRLLSVQPPIAQTTKFVISIDMHAKHFSIITLCIDAELLASSILGAETVVSLSEHFISLQIKSKLLITNSVQEERC